MTFLHCFQRLNLRRTIIAVAPLSIQTLVGISFIVIYMPYYVQLAGYSASQSFKLYLAYTVLSMAGNITSWYLTSRFGRRGLTIYGVALVMLVCLLSAGLGINRSLPYIRGVISLWVVNAFVYNASIGGTAYNILAELPTSRLRAKTSSLGLALQNSLYVSPAWSWLGFRADIFSDYVELCPALLIQSRSGQFGCQDDVHLWGFGRLVSDLSVGLSARGQR